MDKPIRVHIPVFDGVDLFDVTGPIEVLGCGMEDEPSFEIRLVSIQGTLDITTAPRLRLQADVLMVESGPCDILLVPGGPGILGPLEDVFFRGWLAEQAEGARWVTSVCAGSLLLAAAGLLDDHLATTHWASIPALKYFEKVYVPAEFERVIESGNRMTSGGVTSAVDLAILLKARVLGDQAGKDVELLLQYDPQPPFGTGHPLQADPTTRARNDRRLAPMVAERIEVIQRLLGLSRGGALST